MEVHDTDDNGDKIPHQQQKVKRTVAWENHFPNIMRAYTEMQYPLTFICSVCSQEDRGIVFCQDCFPHSYMCAQCFEQTHQHHLLHKPVQWNDEENTYRPFHNFENEVKLTGHEECQSLFWKNVVVVDSEGLQQKVKFWFCHCEPEVACLVRHSLWPSTPSDPCVAFHFNLMEYLRMLVMECHLSIKGFFESLKWKNDSKIQNSIVIKELYRCVTGESFEMYRRFKYTSTHLHHLLPDFDDGTVCPACPTEEEVDKQPIYSFDANFGLVRRKAAGISAKKPFHKGRFFLDQGQVDEFVENYKQQRNEKGCSDFQAGSELRSKNKTSKLAETE